MRTNQWSGLGALAVLICGLISQGVDAKCRCPNSPKAQRKAARCERKAMKRGQSCLPSSQTTVNPYGGDAVQTLGGLKAAAQVDTTSPYMWQCQGNYCTRVPNPNYCPPPEVPRTVPVPEATVPPATEIAEPPEKVGSESTQLDVQPEQVAAATQEGLAVIRSWLVFDTTPQEAPGPLPGAPQSSDYDSEPPVLP